MPGMFEMFWAENPAPVAGVPAGVDMLERMLEIASAENPVGAGVAGAGVAGAGAAGVNAAGAAGGTDMPLRILEIVSALIGAGSAEASAAGAPEAGAAAGGATAAGPESIAINSLCVMPPKPSAVGE